MYLSPANPSQPFYAPPYPYAPSYPSNPPSAFPLPPQADPAACGQNFFNVFQSSYHQSAVPVPLENSSVSRTALSDATTSTVNGSDSTRAANKRKHPSGSGGPGSKRPRTTTEDTSGILESEATPPTTSSSYGSLLDSGLSTSHAAATHIWHFVRGVHSRNRPESALPPEKSTSIRPKERDFPSMCCTLCSYDDGEWTVWQNKTNNSKAILNHLISKHRTIWQDLVIAERLKGWQDITLATRNSGKMDPRVREPFTLEGFYSRLLRWIAVDDQSLNVIDCPELRDLLLYIGRDLEDEDVPHRTKLGKLITSAFKEQYAAMIEEIKHSAGKVSFTSDVWSRQNLEPYMAVTAHYIGKSGKHLVMKSELVAFRRIHGKHDGKNLARVFLEVIKEIGCLNKLNMVTMDNASNNNTCMESLAKELTNLGLYFEKDGNRIRCFPHVLNISVQTSVKELSKPPAHLSISMPSPLPASLVGISEDEYRRQYTLALELDIIGRVRKFVTAVRASGQRRETFMQIIRDANTSGGFGDPPERLRLVGLLKDMEVRWSSLFKMIDRFLQQYPACSKFIKSVSSDFSFEHGFSPVEVQVLLDIREFLIIFHIVQEVVSGERTPTLAFVLPLYEELVTMLRDFAAAKPQLAHAVETAVTKLVEYLNHSRKNPVYAVAIVLNPTTKFEWLENHWSEADCTQARKNIMNMLLDCQRKRRQEQVPCPISATTSQLPTPARQTVNTHIMSDEARGLGTGLTRLHALRTKLSQSLSQPSDSEQSTSSADDPRAIEEENQKVVDDEIAAYGRAGCLAGKDLADFDLLRFWQERQHDFPLLYRVAMDVLPIQASAVPCERVFSSSKETDVLRRSSMGDGMMEQLQILKFRFRSDRLSFTDDLVCSDEELSVIDLDVDVIEDLIATGRVAELHEYIIASWETWGSTEEVEVSPDGASSTSEFNSESHSE